MPLGEAILGAFLAALFEKLASPELLKFASRQGLDSKLKKLEKTLQMIQALLIDAEEKQLTKRAVKLWLDDLRDWAYDAEDILDVITAEALKRELKADSWASASNVQSLLPASLVPSTFKFSYSIGTKIKNITSRLEGLCKQRDDLGLKEITGQTSTASWQRPVSTSVQIEPAVYGRDEDKAKLLDMVFNDEPSDRDVNFRVIPIVGMGGVGKTTLAREVYNDKAVKDFKPRAWICVADDFDVLRISNAILGSVTDGLCSRFSDLNLVQIRLKESVSGKKFLLVLDDVWSKNYDLWEILRSPFMAGAPGSIIIMTTRNAEVASTMGGSIEHYNLKTLSNDDCWSVFLRHAFENRDMDTYPNLELLHQKVVEKCKGLPLAAKTLGGLLRSKQRYEDWKDILSSKIWNLSEESDFLPVLQLSYHHLPSHLKRCFSYCAIFPKDYEFKEKELVLMWIAEGLVQQSIDGKHLEDIGSDYFRNLLSRSIFQPSSSDNSKFKMHDLIHDLAQWVSGDISFRLEDAVEANGQSKRFQRACHSSYTRSYCDGKDKFEVFHNAKRLRTFLPLTTKSRGFLSFISNTVLFDLLPKLKKLRVLSLRNYKIFELPNSIGDLKHLRYLNFSRSDIKILPESINSIQLANFIVS